MQYDRRCIDQRQGNSVTLLKFLKTGQLNVDEDKELAERRQFLECTVAACILIDSTRKTTADQWSGHNDVSFAGCRPQLG